MIMTMTITITLIESSAVQTILIQAIFYVRSLKEPLPNSIHKQSYNRNKNNIRNILLGVNC